MAANEFVSFVDLTALFSRYGIPVPRGELVQSAEEAVKAYHEIDAPVALKIISPFESHKTDKGLLKLGLQSAEAVFSSANVLFGKAEGMAVEGLLVQEMAPEGVEMIAGLVNDPTFGVMLVFGAGGILVELLDDVTLRHAPVSPQEAKWLIRRHAIYRLLQGYRGSPPADVDALAELLARLSVLGKALEGELESLDINPVIVSPAGVNVVDYRMKRKDV